jgi:hypothetical protein
MLESFQVTPTAKTLRMITWINPISISLFFTIAHHRDSRNEAEGTKFNKLYDTTRIDDRFSLFLSSRVHCSMSRHRKREEEQSQVRLAGIPNRTDPCEQESSPDGCAPGSAKHCKYHRYLGALFGAFMIDLLASDTNVSLFSDV